MRSGVEMGRDAQTRGDAFVFRVETSLETAHRHRSGLTLTHEMFSAKVESSSVKLRSSDAVTTGLGAASSL
jgi:hypothetical protein